MGCPIKVTQIDLSETQLHMARDARQEINTTPLRQ